MNIIVFSKNRAAQLELFLRSMKKYFKEFNDHQIKILYKGTSHEFIKGYDKLKDIHPDTNIIWKEDIDFQKCLVELFDKKEKYTVFFVDDIVFKEPFSIKDDKFKFFEKRLDIISLALRLHPRLNYSYPPNMNMRTPNFDKDLVYRWIWQDACYGYPMSLDGNIYKSMDIYFYITNLKYDGPNSLEAQMAANPLVIKPNITCYDKSIIFNNPCNKVQDYNNNRRGNISAEFLNDKFLSGKIIDLEPYIGLENNACHMLLDVNFIDL